MRIAPALSSAKGPALARALAAAQADSPYLARLIRRRPDTAARTQADGPAAAVAAALATLAAAPTRDLDAAAAALRQAKQDVHLALALGDLAGVSGLEAVTDGLTALADAALACALEAAAASLVQRGRLPAPAAGDPAGPAPGFFLVAMGKYGAGELNYSSDIDVTAFFDRDRVAPGVGDGAQRAFVDLVRLVARLMEEVTADGYVFRVDLRLRPDPGSTQPAVSTQAAETYYESFGQNWERAALIKARVVAGDAAAGADFLAMVAPFIWRKHLDFAAIADIQSIKRQIIAHGRHGGVDQPGFDVKLGRGGIRDIEFFVQTQQLILGGREPSLRAPRTLDALAALVASGRLEPAVAQRLDRSYRALRALEHRLQMINDEQTHRLPADDAARATIARLAGYDDLSAFDAAVRALREGVLAADAALFAEAEPLSDAGGSLVFTGVEDDPDTIDTLRRFGFHDPSRVAETVRGWHHGRVRATRSARAREVLTALIPRLLRAAAATGAPDQTFARFQDFFAGLSAGVQVLSLLQAEPRFLDAIMRCLGLAPRLARELARRPAALEALVDPRFLTPVDADPPGAADQALVAALAGAAGLEDAMDRARRAQREAQFRIGFQLLDGVIAPQTAGEAFTTLAEACVRALLPAARAEVERLHGRLEGACAVAGWGKLGGRELSVESDLDLLIVYDPAAGESDGARPLAAEAYFAKVAQRLVTALSSPTAEGVLYPVDLQLRPSGRAGPVAVRASTFERYYDGGDAWTWELLALTRLRPIAGDPGLQRRLAGSARRALTRPRPADAVRADAAAMRARMRKERPGGGLWDLKLAPGGLVDLEFLAQTLVLIHAPAAPQTLAADTLGALARLAAAGVLDPEAAARLIAAGRLMHDLRQIATLAMADGFDPADAPEALKARLAGAAEEPSFAATEEKLKDAKMLVLKAVETHLGATDA